MTHHLTKKKRLTGDPVRKLKFLTWRNNSAWMETMKGPRWNRLLAKEKALSKPLITEKVKHLAKAFEKELVVSRQLQKLEGFQIHNGTIIIASGGSKYFWRWAWSQTYKEMSDIEVYNNRVYYTRDEKEDKYKTELICEDVAGKVIWQKKGVSGQVCIHKGLCYFIKTKNTFNTFEITCCDVDTGSHEELVMEDHDPERFFGIFKTSDDTLFCRSGTWQESKMWRIDGTKTLVRVYEDTVWQMPQSKTCAFLMYEEGGTYVAKGEPLSSWKLPKGEKPVWANIDSGHLITMKEGRQTLYYCGDQTKVVYSVLGDLEPNPWAKTKNNELQSFYVNTPTDYPAVLFVLNDSCQPNLKYSNWAPRYKKILPHLTVKTYHSVSADGTKVPYVLVKHPKTVKPKGLLCYVYSSYGLTSPVGWPYAAWAPLLTRGYAMAFCFARGGGDDSEAWTFAGQREKHVKTVEDFESVVRASQKLTGLGPDQTIIYGRSAGGGIVGATTMRNPDGDLMGTTFTEVPFVDYLRSMTNPELGLTPSGLSEFGDPMKDPWIFRETLRLSPMDSMPVDGAPGVFVLVRTGLKDQQVAPFEPVKFIQKLRGTNPSGAEDKYLFFEPKEVHTYSGEAFVRTRAMDLAILYDHLQKKSHPRVYTMARPTRRNTKSKKSRRGTRKMRGGNKQQQKQQQQRQQQQGGKKRRPSRKQ